MPRVVLVDPPKLYCAAMRPWLCFLVLPPILFITPELAFPIPEAQNTRMAAGDEKIPGPLMMELERVARAQQRTVSEVVTEAIERYIQQEQWLRLKVYGREKAHALGLTEDDVPRLIEESRRESKQGR